MLAENIKLQIPACFYQGFEYLAPIQTAITSKTILQLAYKNNKDETSIRQVEPLGLIFYALNWHLIAWCHIRKDYRDFRVNRITGLKNTDKPFTNSKHISLDEYMKQIPVNY